MAVRHPAKGPVAHDHWRREAAFGEARRTADDSFVARGVSVFVDLAAVGKDLRVHAALKGCALGLELARRLLQVGVGQITPAVWPHELQAEPARFFGLELWPVEHPLGIATGVAALEHAALDRARPLQG